VVDNTGRLSLTPASANGTYTVGSSQIIVITLPQGIQPGSAKITVRGTDHAFTGANFTLPTDVQGLVMSSLDGKRITLTINGKSVAFGISVPPDVASTQTQTQAQTQAAKDSAARVSAANKGGAPRIPYKSKGIFYDAFALSQPGILTDGEWDRLIIYY